MISNARARRELSPLPVVFRAAAGLTLHFPGLAPDATVRQWFDSVKPPELDQEENLLWLKNGRDTLHLSWAGCCGRCAGTRSSSNRAYSRPES